MTDEIQECVKGSVEVFNHLEDGVKELRKESEHDMKKGHFGHIKTAVLKDFIPAVKETLDTIDACHEGNEDLKK
jgi:hypothetical protein